MDGSTFDRLTRALGSGVSRRAALKAAVGIGGAGALHTQCSLEASAARRPTPIPKPVTCPGNQYWDGNRCLCHSGVKCGPDCCTVGSECCDNACCYGSCYGEELCCPDGQIVCDGACLPLGECCDASDCAESESCVAGVCSLICLPVGADCDSNEECCTGLCNVDDRVCDCENPTPICDRESDLSYCSNGTVCLSTNSGDRYCVGNLTWGAESCDSCQTNCPLEPEACDFGFEAGFFACDGPCDSIQAEFGMPYVCFVTAYAGK